MSKMKIWIGTDRGGYRGPTDRVCIYRKKPKYWNRYSEFWRDSDGKNYPALVCRDAIKPLLRGTGKKLPRHGSKNIVELEVSAK